MAGDIKMNLKYSMKSKTREERDQIKTQLTARERGKKKHKKEMHIFRGDSIHLVRVNRNSYGCEFGVRWHVVTPGAERAEKQTDRVVTHDQ